MNAPSDFNVVWKPLEGTSQAFALDSRARHTLYCGTRGPGKTDCQLMKFRRYVGLGYGSYWRGVIFDRRYKNLDDIVNKSVRWFSQFGDGAKWHGATNAYKWSWPTGEELLIRAIEKDQDYLDFHGQEFPFIGWNELTKYPTGRLYNKMLSVNRTSFMPDEHTPKIFDKYGNFVQYDTADGKPLPELPLMIFSTTNPSGPGHTWVKNMFINPAPYGKVITREREIFNPRTQLYEVVETKQVAIFGSYKENKYLTPEYIASLYDNDDPDVLKAWLTGSWDITSGGALDDLWRPAVHIIPRFRVPSNWRVDRAFDWGSSHPYSVGWFAEANGESVQLPDGTWFTPTPGSLIQIYELYGSKEIGSNVGLRKGSSDLAREIAKVDDMLFSQGWIGSTVRPGPADNQISNVNDKDTETIAEKMRKEGVTWESSDKSKGSRKHGLELIRERLRASIVKERPGLYFFDNCIASITTIPILPRDEDNTDDVDTDAEDHAFDMVKYRVLKAANRLATKLDIRMPM